MHRTLILGLASIAVGAVIPRQASDTNSTDPCARVVNFYDKYATPGAIITVPNGAAVAQECLHSIPFSKDLATAYLKEVNKYVQFQSTLEILKDPPPTYISHAFDIVGSIQAIEAKVEASEYSSYYDFESELLLAFRYANDGHFGIGTCTTRIFQFSRGLYELVLASDDGISVPQLYLEYNNTRVGGESGPAVATIQGQNATDYLNALAELQSNQDPDARWNNLFPSYAAFANSGSPGGLLGAFSTDGGLWPGANITVVGFADGSTTEVPTILQYKFANTTGIVDGESLFQSICIPSPTTTQNPSNSSEDATSPTESEALPTETEAPPTEPDPTQPQNTSLPAPPFPTGPMGYPDPVYLDGYNNFAGYYLDDDTAVLFIPTFEINPESSDNETGIVSNLEAAFVSAALSSGHSKLIIDLSGNGGGTIALAWNLFRLFFPTEFPYSATRFRRHPSIDILTNILGSVDLATAPNVTGLLKGNVPDYPYTQVRPDQMTPVTSAQDLLGDNIVQYGVPLSSLYANFNYSRVSSFNTEPIRGYGDVPLKFTSPPYAAEDILILTDGTCSSTCTTFVNLMTNVGNVRSIAFGGRPQTGPMQPMGGVRGAQAIGADRIAAGFALGGEILVAGYYNLTDQEAQTLNDTHPIPLSQFPVITSSLGVNLRNAYQEGNDELPLQFQYQAADCRLFYTKENYAQPETQWRDASKAIWGGGSCVEGSQGAWGSLAWRQTHGNGTIDSGWKGV